VIVDLRTYRLIPGRVPAQLELYGKLGYPVQLRYMGEPLCYLVGESGQLNTFVHGWVYESAGDREQKRAAMMKEPDWQAYLRKNVETGYIVDQRTSLMVPAKFAPIKR
jgi:hypothetical protein